MHQSNYILLIEDDPAVVQSLQVGLEREGYSVTWKDTGTAGIAHARDHNPHLIILDVRLPDGSGFDFCRRMRQLGLRQPILMLTVQGDEIAARVGQPAGQCGQVHARGRCRPGWTPAQG
jgi:DNA-binding response OmpR family regulator